MKLLPAIIAVFLILYSVNSKVRADSAASKQSYLNFSDLYRSAYQDYVTSKNKFLTYQTLASENEALGLGKNFLKIREQYLILYLNYLRDRVLEQGGFTETERNLLVSKISVESEWLASHRRLFDTPLTLRDLQKTAEQTQERYETIIKPVALQTGGEIVYNKASILQQTLVSIYSGLEQQLLDVGQTGVNLTLEQRWLLEAKNKTEAAKAKQNEAIVILINLKGQNLIADYNRGIFLLTESNQYMREASSFLLEIVKSIKGE